MLWIETHPELVVAIFATVSAVAGYIYRARSEKRENLREALFLLLEIWHRVSVLSKRSFAAEFDALTSNIRRLVPNATISREELEKVKAYVTPILQRLIKGIALDDFDGLQDAYAKAVKLISRSDPIFAYRIDSLTSIKKRLQFVDQYMREVFPPLEQKEVVSATQSQDVQEQLSALVEQEAVRDLEVGLRGLSIRISIYAYVAILIRIRRRHRMLESVPLEDLDRLLKKVLISAFSQNK